MTDLFSASTYCFTALTVIVFALASAFQKKMKLVIFNPVLISVLVIIGLLSVLDIPYAMYQESCRVLSYLLTPATICLAISFYEQIDRLKKHLVPIVIGVLVGSVCSLGCIYLMAKAFALPDAMLYSLLPKSVTTAIGVVLSEELGGIAAITTAVIIITGITGNILLTPLSKLLRLDNPIAQGVATGTSSHVIGTTRAFEVSEMAGAVSSLSLTVAGLATSVLLSFLAPYL